MEYLGPSMSSPASHVIPKNEIFGPKNEVDSKYGLNTSTGCDRSHVTFIKTKMASFLLGGKPLNLSPENW